MTLNLTHAAGHSGEQVCSPAGEARIEEEEQTLNRIRAIFDDIDNLSVSLSELCDEGKIKEKDFKIMSYLLCRVGEKLEEYL